MIAFTEENEGSTLNYDRFQFDFLRPYIQGRALEIGAGAGRITRLAVDSDPSLELVVAEPSPHFSGLLQRSFGTEKRVCLLQAEIGALAADNAAAFDSIFAVCVMEHIEDDRRFLEEAAALLKPGGTICLIVPAFQFLYSTLDRNIGHFRRYDRPMVRTLVSQTELRVQKLKYINFIGFFGSLYFSKIKKVNYQEGAQSKQSFFRLYSIFSKYFVPVIAAIEKRIPVPFGLSLVIVLEKPE